MEHGLSSNQGCAHLNSNDGVWEKVKELTIDCEKIRHDGRKKVLFYSGLIHLHWQHLLESIPVPTRVGLGTFSIDLSK